MTSDLCGLRVSTGMDFNLWYIVAGVLFVVMALSGTALRRLPLTTSMLYLTVGVDSGRTASGILSWTRSRSRGSLSALPRSPS